MTTDCSSFFCLLRIYSVLIIVIDGTRQDSVFDPLSYNAGLACISSSARAVWAIAELKLEEIQTASTLARARSLLIDVSSLLRLPAVTCCAQYIGSQLTVSTLRSVINERLSCDSPVSAPACCVMEQDITNISESSRPNTAVIVDLCRRPKCAEVSITDIINGCVSA